MANTDWNRFGRHLKGLGKEVTSARDMYLLSLGISVGGLFAVVTWLAELFQIAQPSPVFIGAGVITIAVTLGATGVAFMSRQTHIGLAKKLRRDSDLLYDDMDYYHPFDRE